MGPATIARVLEWSVNIRLSRWLVVGPPAGLALGLRLFFLFLLSNAFATIAFSHPLASRYFGQRLELRLSETQFEVDYYAEVPAIVLLDEIKSEFASRGKPGAGDALDFHRARVLELARGFALDVDGVALPITFISGDVDWQRSNAWFYVYVLKLSAVVPAGGSHHLTLRNSNYPEQPTVFSTGFKVSPHLLVHDCSLFAESRAREFKDDDGIWDSTENHRDFQVRWSEDVSASAIVGRGYRSVVGGNQPEWVSAPSAAPASGLEQILGIVRGGLAPGGPLLVALFLAAFLGAAHALTPGHGKVLVASYLVGARGTVRHAVLLGGIVSLSHTVSVFMMGFVALVLSEWAAPELLYPWIELCSGVLVFAIGLVLLRQRLGGLGGVVFLRTLFFTPALGSRHPHGPHDQLREHGAHNHAQGDIHAHAHAHVHAHDAPTGVAPPTMRSLLSLGVSGGMVPCPSALVVLLTAIAFHRLLFGMALVVSFSIGLSAVLIASGVLVVQLGERFLAHTGGKRWLRFLPIGSACVILVLGGILTVRALRVVL